MRLDVQIEGLLFYKAAPVKTATLSKVFGVSENDIETALQVLKERIKNGATKVIITDTDVELVTVPELDTLIDGIRKDELKRDIGKAGAETLAIIVYRGPMTRPEIDRIRGVNSSFILRNLMVRGLVERKGEGKQIHYQSTPDLLAHLGITEKSDLPEFETLMNRLDVYEKEQEEQPI